MSLYTGLVKQLDKTAAPCPLSFGPNRAPAHIEDEMQYMRLFREETTVAEPYLVRDMAIHDRSLEVECWYFRCMVCNLILPANRMRS